MNGRPLPRVAKPTFEEGVQGQEVDADRTGKHSYREAQQFYNDGPGWGQRRSDTAEKAETHAGTAGAMLDFSDALGVLPSRSSFSRTFFSLEMIRLDVMIGM